MLTWDNLPGSRNDTATMIPHGMRRPRVRAHAAGRKPESARPRFTTACEARPSGPHARGTAGSEIKSPQVSAKSRKRCEHVRLTKRFPGKTLLAISRNARSRPTCVRFALTYGLFVAPHVRRMRNSPKRGARHEDRAAGAGHAMPKQTCPPGSRPGGHEAIERAAGTRRKRAAACGKRRQAARRACPRSGRGRAARSRPSSP